MECFFLGLDVATKTGAAVVDQRGIIHHVGTFDARKQLRIPALPDDAAGYCIIERPYCGPGGVSISTDLAYLCGQCAAIAELQGWQVVAWMYPAQWRAVAGIRGNLKRAEAKAAAFELAKIRGYHGYSEDVAEAICIAHAARMLHATGRYDDDMYAL
jgi:hypothetical protein